VVILDLLGTVALCTPHSSPHSPFLTRKVNFFLSCLVFPELLGARFFMVFALALSRFFCPVNFALLPLGFRAPSFRPLIFALHIFRARTFALSFPFASYASLSINKYKDYKE
jgi:hypothetical protein